MAQAIEMARRSKLKRQRLFWFRRMETLSRPPKTMGLNTGRGETRWATVTVQRLVVSSENLEEAFAAFPDSQALPLGGLIPSRRSLSGEMGARVAAAGFLVLGHYHEQPLVLSPECAFKDFCTYFALS